MWDLGSLSCSQCQARIEASQVNSFSNIENMAACLGPVGSARKTKRGEKRRQKSRIRPDENVRFDFRAKGAFGFRLQLRGLKGTLIAVGARGIVSMSREITVSMDFHSDWIALLRERLEEAGYTTGQEEEGEICHLYFNAGKRMVPAQPRRIHLSREFRCPPDHATGLRFLEDKIRNGADLTPHLSRKILKLSYNDPILNDWGIHHFHLGLTHDAKGLIEGTPYILLARVTNDQFYMIDVVRHN